VGDRWQQEVGTVMGSSKWSTRRVGGDGKR
jgi:hypothetical protein